MRQGERQVAPTLDGIRRDHVARYRWAATHLPPGARVVDCGCGVGYGAAVLADAGHAVDAFDCDATALDYARLHYARPGIVHALRDLSRPIAFAGYDAAIAFEIVEHLADPLPLLRALRASAGTLLASVPNETVLPFTGQLYHHRHYTPVEFKALLRQAGWAVAGWWAQDGTESDVVPGLRDGRTLVVQAVPAPAEQETDSMPFDPGTIVTPAPPEHVAILGLGPSVGEYLSIAKRLGARGKVADEVWAINALGDILACDRIFHMDDVRVQEARAAAAPQSNIAAMLPWLRRHPGPIVTSRLHPDYPGLVEFPLEAVINRFGMAYFNSTAAYAIAYALFIGVKKISLYGMDFTYPDAHDAEKGRACVEYWLGRAHAMGVSLRMPQRTTLMDAIEPQAHRLYGYDTVDISLGRNEDGSCRVTMLEKPQPVDAAEIEDRYDHGRHPAEKMMEEATP